MKEFFIYVVSASISQPQNQALGSILKLSMKVFTTKCDYKANRIQSLNKHIKSIHVSEEEVV